jgi:hypothetical protein
MVIQAPTIGELSNNLAKMDKEQNNINWKSC